MIANALSVTGLVILYLWPRYFFISVAGKGVSGFTLFAFILLFVALFQLAMRKDMRRATAAGFAGSGIVLALFGLYWVWRLIASFAGVTPGSSIGYTLLAFLYQGSWFLIGAILLTDRQLRTSLPRIVLICGIIAALAGLIEFQTGQPISRILGFYEFQAGDEYTLRNISDTLERGSAVRIRSLYSHPLVYGQMLAAMMPIALHFLFRGSFWGKIGGGALVLAVVVSILLCNARSPILVGIAASAIYFFLYFFDPKQRMKLFVLMWAGIGALFVLPVATGAFLDLTQGRTSEEASSSVARDRQMTSGVNALRARPITGYGDGNAPFYAGVLGRNDVRTVDNFYLSTAVDSGYVGVVIWIALLLGLTVKGIGLGFTETDQDRRSHICIAVATVSSLALGLSILSIVDTQSIIFLFGGFLVALTGLQRTAPIMIRRRPAFAVADEDLPDLPFGRRDSDV